MNPSAGEKLSESNALDVRELCNTLLNCYLTQVGSPYTMAYALCWQCYATIACSSWAEPPLQMLLHRLSLVDAQLLETGLLHADPHPGNLLRTPDGKVCILDFGLMVRLQC